MLTNCLCSITNQNVKNEKAPQARRTFKGTTHVCPRETLGGYHFWFVSEIPLSTGFSWWIKTTGNPSW